MASSESKTTVLVKFEGLISRKYYELNGIWNVDCVVILTHDVRLFCARDCINVSIWDTFSFYPQYNLKQMILS